MEKYLEFAIETARGAGEITKKYFYGENGANYKYDRTIVTKADTATGGSIYSFSEKGFVQITRKYSDL